MQCSNKNWFAASVDLDRVVRDVDIAVLQEHVSTIVRCDLGDLRGLDVGLVKLVRLAQLCLEYCLFCQEQLALSQADLEQAHEQTLNVRKPLTHMHIFIGDELQFCQFQS
jgi:hypothetical protein